MIDRDPSDPELMFEVSNSLKQKNCTMQIYQTGRSNPNFEPCTSNAKSGDFISGMFAMPCETPGAAPSTMIELTAEFARLEDKLSNIPNFQAR